MMQCVAHGHDVVALANLRPSDGGKILIKIVIEIIR